LERYGEVAYIRGQGELAASGYRHWQIMAAYKSKVRLARVKQLFGTTCHAEPTRSDAAREYVWKEETRIAGTQFEFGLLQIRRGNSQDWAAVRRSAQSGQLEDIPPDLYVRYYGNIKKIASDNLKPVAIVRRVLVYWGATGVGKSRRAWEEAGIDAYPKDPRTKFWDGYMGHAKVVIDEFRGGIDISHVLRWFDRYPVIVEVKGSSVVLKATDIWITSNIHPKYWYPDLDAPTLDALMRRLKVTEIKPFP